MTRILTNLTNRISILCERRGMARSGSGWNIQRAIGGVGEGGTAAVDADGHTADEVAEANGQTSPEEGEAGVVCVGGVHLGALDGVNLGGEDDGHDDAVDGDDLAEDDGDEVLGADARRPDAGTEDRRAGDEDSPAGTGCVSLEGSIEPVEEGEGGKFGRTMLRRQRTD